MLSKTILSQATACARMSASIPAAQQTLAGLVRSGAVLTRLPVRTFVSKTEPTDDSALHVGSEARDVGSRHFRLSNQPHPLYSEKDEAGRPIWVNPFGNQVWSKEDVYSVEQTHVETKGITDRIAFATVKLLRYGFDILSGYAFGPINEKKFLRRAIFLETVAGIPGMVAGAIRHLNSLRRMQRDHGWIHTLLEEAENERMHLLTFMKMRQPGIMFRGMVLVAQGIFWNGYFFTYLVSPKLCHRFVGYLEEEAVKTYSGAIQALDNGQMPTWTHEAAPDIAKTYWGLAEDATMRDVLLAIRADEAHHRDVNHTLSTLKADATNPFVR